MYWQHNGTRNVIMMCLHFPPASAFRRVKGQAGTLEGARQPPLSEGVRSYFNELDYLRQLEQLVTPFTASKC